MNNVIDVKGKMFNPEIEAPNTDTEMKFVLNTNIEDVNATIIALIALLYISKGK